MDQPANVYVMASRRNGTLYTGSTPDLARRAWEHRNLVVPGFTRRHGCTLLVWYEQHADLPAAGHRERQIKEWRREWKLGLIERMNPAWADPCDRIAHG